MRPLGSTSNANSPTHHSKSLMVEFFPSRFRNVLQFIAAARTQAVQVPFQVIPDGRAGGGINDEQNRCCVASCGSVCNRAECLNALLRLQSVLGLNFHRGDAGTKFDPCIVARTAYLSRHSHWRIVGDGKPTQFGFCQNVNEHLGDDARLVVRPRERGIPAHMLLP
jgi:hypothetical protein